MMAAEMKLEIRRHIYNPIVFFSSLSSNYYNKPANTAIPLQNPAIGDFCVARFSEDHHWYRARVVLIHGSM
jgi:hypothetical protein